MLNCKDIVRSWRLKSDHPDFQKYRLAWDEASAAIQEALHEKIQKLATEYNNLKRCGTVSPLHASVQEISNRLFAAIEDLLGFFDKKE